MRVLLGLASGRLKPVDVLPKTVVLMFTWFNQADGTRMEEFSLDGTNRHPPDGFAATRPSWYDGHNVINFVPDDGCLPIGTRPDGDVRDSLPLLSKKQKKRLARQQEKEQAVETPVMAPQPQRLEARYESSLGQPYEFNLLDGFGLARHRLMQEVNNRFNNRI